MRSTRGLMSHSSDVRGFGLSTSRSRPYLFKHSRNNNLKVTGVEYVMKNTKTKSSAGYDNTEQYFFRGRRMITSQQLALMIAWCPLVCWLTHDPHFNESCNRGHYSVSVGSRSREDGKMKGTHWSVGCRWDDSLNRQWETGAMMMCNRHSSTVAKEA